MQKVKLMHQGKSYTATYHVSGDEVSVFHNLATKRATIGQLPVALLARQLLFELVAREGLGIPDPDSGPEGSDKPA